MQKPRLVRFYKPGRTGWVLHRERVIHKDEVFNALVNHWLGCYGKGSVVQLAL